jgi:hypothetical protein
MLPRQLDQPLHLIYLQGHAPEAPVKKSRLFFLSASVAASVPFKRRRK